MGTRKNSRAKSTPGTTKPASGPSDLLRRAINWIVTDAMFADLKKHGNVNWQAKPLILLAVLTAWIDAKQLTQAFEKATTWSQRWYGVIAIETYQGLMRALTQYNSQLLPRMWERLQSLMAQVSPKHFRIGRWLPLAVDGSRFSTPRTLSNELAFAARNFGRGKKARSRAKWKNKRRRSKKLGAPVKPQIWLTLVWHMGLKLPWRWKTGPSTSSERHHLIDLARNVLFPKNTLFCADAGFVGYELWSSLVEPGHSFLIRVGANVRLLKNLGRFRFGDGIVCLWPKDAMQRGTPPLLLRLVEAKGERGSMFLVTNVLSESALSTPMLKRLYPLRWGVELQFRAAKQTFGLGTLRSRNSAHALVELDWSLVSLTMIQLLAIKEQTTLDIPPERTSVAQAIRAIQHAIDHWNQLSGPIPGLRQRLRAAVTDTYVRRRPKTARYHHNLKDKPTATRPIVQIATREQRQAYAALKLAARK